MLAGWVRRTRKPLYPRMSCVVYLYLHLSYKSTKSTEIFRNIPYYTWMVLVVLEHIEELDVSVLVCISKSSLTEHLRKKWVESGATELDMVI